MLVDDASGVVDDTMKALLQRSTKTAARLDEIIELLEDFGR
jgi:uncharacterized protein Yka (UPF0111/DUF47 family)